MNFRTAVLAYLFFVGIAGADNATDPVAESFDRALNHEAAPLPDPVRTNIDDDVLYRLINQPLQSADESAPVTADNEQADDDAFESVAAGEGE